MKYYIKLFYPVLIFIFSFQGFSQTVDENIAKYNLAKDYLVSARYEEAAKIFTDLARKYENYDFSPYSYYYAAFCNYKTGTLLDANFLLYQLITRHEDWPNIDMAYYLKGVVQFESKKYGDGITQFGKIKSGFYVNEASKAKYNYLNKLTDDTLRILENKFPTDEIVKSVKRERSNQQVTVIKKNQNGWKIALLLPFESIGKNHFVYELYEGMKLAADSLNKVGIDITLVPFESGKDSVKVYDFINTPESGNFDLVVGPLYTGQQKAISDFALSKNVYVVNPLSNFSTYSNTNPNYFLFMPSYETQGRRAAQFAYQNFARTHSSVVVYGNALGDSLIADAYKSELEKNGGKVLIYKKLTKFSSGYFGTMMNKTSLDSVGHIFIASSDASLAANVFSYLEGTLLEKASAYRETLNAKAKDSVKTEAKRLSVSDVPIFTLHEWLDVQSISYEQFMLHNTHFLYPEFTDPEAAGDKYLYKNYYNRLSTPPTTFVYQGFNLIFYFGKVLEENGRELAKSIRNAKGQPGYAMPFFDFSESNNNRFVPIVKIEDYKLKLVNQP